MRHPVVFGYLLTYTYVYLLTYTYVHDMYVYVCIYVYIVLRARESISALPKPPGAYAV
jgi:hypothetical protein